MYAVRINGQKLDSESQLRWLLGKTDFYDLTTPLTASVSMDGDADSGQVVFFVYVKVTLTCVYVCMYVCMYA